MSIVIKNSDCICAPEQVIIHRQPTGHIGSNRNDITNDSAWLVEDFT